MVSWKVWAGLLGAAAFFVGGYQYAAALYGEDIAALSGEKEKPRGGWTRTALRGCSLMWSSNG